MKLSYIVPVYNVERYLKQCVDSILAQDMDEYEIILVDDGSPDGCPAICDEYNRNYPDIIRVIHKENEGPAKARNVGIEAALGEYLFFVDSDDYLTDGSVKALYEKAVELDVDVLQSTYYSLNEKTNKLYRKEPNLPPEKVYSHEDMAHEICFVSSKRMIVFMWKNLYRRSFIIENGIHLDESLKMVEDPPFNMWAYCAAERFAAVDMPVYCYRIRDNSLQRQKYVENYDLIIEKQWCLKLEYYERYFEPRSEFYGDIGEYTVKAILPLLLRNIYINKRPEQYEILKRIAKSRMMEKSFEAYDINNFKSKSLDWLMTWFIKNKMYYPAHILCQRVLYK